MLKLILNKIILTLIVVVSMSVLGTAQQESHFTQFMYNKLTLNPAYAGVRGIPSLTALYRKQWVGFDGAPTSKLISLDAPIFGDKVGFGLTISNRSIGIMNDWNGNMAYSYHVKISDKSSFRVGLQGSMRFQGIDFADPGVFIQEQGDQSIMEDETSNDYFINFGAGLYYTYDQFYVGVSVPNFLPSEIGFVNPQATDIAKTTQHYYLMTGAMIPMSDKINLKPALLAKYVQNAPFDMDINLSLVYDLRMTVGLSYRLGGTGSGDSVDLLAMYQANQIGIGVAYDYSLSDINEQTNGSFEVLVRYDFVKEREDMANPRFFY